MQRLDAQQSEMVNRGGCLNHLKVSDFESLFLLINDRIVNDTEVQLRDQHY